MSRTPLDRWRTIKFIAWTKIIGSALDELRQHTPNGANRNSTSLARELYISLAKDAGIEGPPWTTILNLYEKAILKLISRLKIAVDLRDKERTRDGESPGHNQR